MTTELVRVFLSSRKVRQQSIVLNWDMIIVVVVMKLRSIALMNNGIDVLLDAWLRQVNIGVGTRDFLCFSWRVYVMTRMIKILLSVEHQRTLQCILFLKWSQCNLFLPDILFGHSLLVVRCEPHIKALWAKCWSANANWLLSTTRISAIWSILLDRYNRFRNCLVCFGAFLFLISFDLSWWIKLLNDWISVLRFRHILLFSFPIWWLVWLVEYIRVCSDRWIGSNWAWPSN